MPTDADKVHRLARIIYDDTYRKVGWDPAFENAEWHIRDKCYAEAERQFADVHS